MSEGIKSGVNWMRLKVQLMESAKARAKVVLPIPGTSSIRRWPPLRIAARHSSITSPFPTNTCSTLVLTLSANSARLRLSVGDVDAIWVIPSVGRLKLETKGDTKPGRISLRNSFGIRGVKF